MATIAVKRLISSPQGPLRFRLIFPRLEYNLLKMLISQITGLHSPVIDRSA